MLIVSWVSDLCNFVKVWLYHVYITVLRCRPTFISSFSFIVFHINLVVRFILLQTSGPRMYSCLCGMSFAHFKVCWWTKANKFYVGMSQVATCLIGNHHTTSFCFCIHYTYYEYYVLIRTENHD